MISDVNYEITQFFNLLVQEGYDEDDAELLADDLALDIKATVDATLYEFQRIISYAEIDYSKVAKSIYDKFDVQKIFRESPFPMFDQMEDENNVDEGFSQDDGEGTEDEVDNTPVRPQSSYELGNKFEENFKTKRGRRRREIEAGFINRIKEGAKKIITAKDRSAGTVDAEKISWEIENYIGDALLQLIMIYKREYLD